VFNAAMNTKLFNQIKTLGIFLFVGGVTAFIYFTVLTLTLGMLDYHYPLSIGIAYCFAICFQFFANRELTFKVKSKIFPQMVRFLGWAGISYLLTLGIWFLTYQMFNWAAYQSAIIGLICTSGIGFLISKKWVYT